MARDPSSSKFGVALIAPLLFLAASLGVPIAAGRLLATADALAQDFPQRLLVAAAWRQGHWPFWNPFDFGGFPLFATIHTGPLFPGNAPFLFLPPTAAMNLAVTLAYALVGYGAYLYARIISLGRVAASFSATAFMGSGFMARNLTHLQILQAAALLPWLLWSIERHGRAQTSRLPWTVSLVVALGILAGHPQISAYALLTGAAYALWREQRLSRSAWLVLAVLLGVGLSAVQLLPTWDFIETTQRHVISYQRLTLLSPDVRALGLLASPYLFGATYPTALTPYPLWATDWAIVAMGWMALSAGVVALLAVTRWRESSLVRFWGSFAGVTFLLALGHTTPLYRLWALIPVLDTMPYPARHFFECSFAIAILAGIGLDELAAGRVSRRAIACVWGGVGLMQAGLLAGIACGSAGFIQRTQPLLPPGVDLRAALSLANPALWLPVGIWLALGVALAGFAFRPAARWRWMPLGLLVLEQVVFAHCQGYVNLGPHAQAVSTAFPVTPYRGREFVVPAQAYPYTGDLAPLLNLHMPCLGALAGARTINGYDAFVYQRFLDVLGMESNGYPQGTAPWSGRARVLDVLGARTLRMDPQAAASPLWQTRLQNLRWPAHGRDGDVLLFVNPQALPQAWRPARWHVSDAPRVNAHLLGALPFAPLTDAWLEEPPQANTFQPGSVVATSTSFGTIRLDSRGLGPGLILVSEAYDPGWNARLLGRDGSPGVACPVHRADGLILGVEVPPGDVSVLLSYEPPGWRLGLALSLLSTLLLLVISRARIPYTGKNPRALPVSIPG